jgi:hypothetical protein
MARHSNPLVQLQRIKYVSEFLSKGGGSLVELSDYVNEKIQEKGMAPVKTRTIQYDLEKLASGEFAHSQQHLSKSKLGLLFKYQYKNKQYSWAPGSEVPVFDDLDEAERMTLPFLFGILKRYEHLPAIQKIVDTLDEKYEFSNSSSFSNEAFYVQSPVFQNSSFENKLTQLVLKLLDHIQKNEIIEFHYATVGNLDDGMTAFNAHCIAPIQVRLYENYYYLCGIDVEKMRIINFRVDQIRRFKVDNSWDEDGEIETFDRNKLKKQVKFDQHFKHVLGVWNHHSSDLLHRVTIDFHGWAASYVKRIKLHDTQRFVSEDIEAKRYTISLDILLFPETIKGKKVQERSPELSFLLGRFRDAAKIVGYQLL